MSLKPSIGVHLSLCRNCLTETLLNYRIQNDSGKTNWPIKRQMQLKEDYIRPAHDFKWFFYVFYGLILLQSYTLHLGINEILSFSNHI